MYCQKCRTLLRLDGSLQDLNPSAFKLLVGKVISKFMANPPVLTILRVHKHSAESSLEYQLTTTTC